LRRRTVFERKREQLGRELEVQQELAEDDLDTELDDDVGDDLLRLMFIACHPVLPTEGRVALTLRLLGGLTTPEIARAFLVPEPTVAQRIVRAKRTLAEARVPFEVPHGAERAARLSSVLEVIYLVFNEGYAATAGDDWVRPALCEDALRLGRILAAHMPHEPEVHGLVALIELQASRLRARIGPSGEPVLLLDQNRARWDHLLIRRGLAALQRAEQLGGGASGPYVLQAAIAACHARARTAEATDWARIAALYDALARLMPSPVVELNRAVAHGMAFGPAAGLELVDALTSEPSLKGYHLLPAARGDLLAKLGRGDEARAEFERAATLTRNARERDLLLQRAAACAGTASPRPSPPGP
jgi:predicted RNA polymerase sigma factor